MTERCANCGVKCCGNMRLNITLKKHEPFCPECFNLLVSVSSKELRKILKK